MAQYQPDKEMDLLYDVQWEIKCFQTPDVKPLLFLSVSVAVAFDNHDKEQEQIIILPINNCDGTSCMQYFVLFKSVYVIESTPKRVRTATSAKTFHDMVSANCGYNNCCTTVTWGIVFCSVSFLAVFATS